MTIVLDDANCFVGAVRRVIIGDQSIEFCATTRDDAGRLVWERKP